MSVINISDSDSDDIGEESKIHEVKQEHHYENILSSQDEVLKLFGRDSAKTALEILFNGADYEAERTPYGIRKTCFCALRHDAVSVESCKAEGNGAYIRRSEYKTLYKIDYSEDGNEIVGIFTCRKEEMPDGEKSKLYFNKRVGRGYEKKMFPMKMWSKYNVFTGTISGMKHSYISSLLPKGLCT